MIAVVIQQRGNRVIVEGDIPSTPTLLLKQRGCAHREAAVRGRSRNRAVIDVAGDAPLRGDRIELVPARWSDPVIGRFAGHGRVATWDGFEATSGEVPKATRGDVARFGRTDGIYRVAIVTEEHPYRVVVASAEGDERATTCALLQEIK